MTGCPGRNLRVAGFGVCSVRISMGAMWPHRALRSSAKGWRAGDHPADHPDRDSQTDQSHPPFAWPHWLDAWIDRGASGDHWLCEVFAAKAVEKDRPDV